MHFEPEFTNLLHMIQIHHFSTFFQFIFRGFIFMNCIFLLPRIRISSSQFFSLSFSLVIFIFIFISLQFFFIL